MSAKPTRPAGTVSSSFRAVCGIADVRDGSTRGLPRAAPTRSTFVSTAARRCWCTGVSLPRGGGSTSPGGRGGRRTRGSSAGARGAPEHGQFGRAEEVFVAVQRVGELDNQRLGAQDRQLYVLHANILC